MIYKPRTIMNVYFKLRISTNGRTAPASVVCQVQINRESATQFATGVSCLPSDWNYQDKRINAKNPHNRTQNTFLDKIEREVFELCDHRKIQNLPISAKIIKEIYTQEPVKIPCFIELIELRLEDCRIKKLTESSITQYQSYKNLFVKYLKSVDKNDISLYELTPELFEKIKNFSSRSTNSNHLVLVFVKSCLKFAVKKQFIDKHPLLFEDNPREPNKELIYLEETQIKILLEKSFNYQIHEDFRKAFLFQCFTGLAFEEITKFRKTESIKFISGKEFIMVYRKKTKKHYAIPILKQAREILKTIDNGFNITALHEYNLFIRFLGEIIDFKNIAELSSHVGRKTAGFYLLNNGVPIEVVSSILGHADIRTTQKIYASVLTKYVDAATLHLQ